MTTQLKVPERLATILGTCRGYGGAAEKQFVDEWMRDALPAGATKDEYGSWWYANNISSRTLFCCHTDTVHDIKLTKQTVLFDANKGELFKDAKDKTPSCLGADDGAGVWLLLEMIDAGVPGTYAFFRGEERGSPGSSGAANTSAELLQTFDRAIAFDRRGTSSVITHQGWGRCASDKFGTALADALNGHGLKYKPDDTGVFTDTANLTDLIGECTNVSCGYYNEHTGKETLDLNHLLALRDACVKLDWESLPTERKPGEEDESLYGRWGGYGSPYSWQNIYGYNSREHKTTTTRYPSYGRLYDDVELADLYEMDAAEIDDFVYENPSRASEMIQQMLGLAAMPDDGAYEEDEEDEENWRGVA